MNKKNVWWLSVTSFLTDVSSEMIFPVLPIFLKSVLGAPFFLIGLIEGVAEGLAAFFKYFAGFFSDWIKKRKGLTFLGYALSALSKLFFALARSSYIVLAFRSVDRIGKGIRTAPRDALIAESVAEAERGRYFGFHRAADTAGAVVGTIIAIGILYFVKDNISEVLRLILFLSFIPAVAGILFLFAVKETPANDIVASYQQERRKLFSFGKFSPNFKFFLIMSGFYGLANYSYAFYILRAQDIGVVLALIPAVYLVYNLFYASSVYPAGRLSDRIGRKKLLVAAFLLFAAVNLGFAFSANKSTIWMLFAFYGLFIGLTDGVLKAFVADLSIEERHGEAFGLYHMVIGFTTLGGNLLGGVIWQFYGAAWPFVLSSVFILIALFMLVVGFRGHQQYATKTSSQNFKGYRG